MKKLKIILFIILCFIFIGNFSSLMMPKAFEKNQVVFSSGNKGTIGNSNVDYTKDGNIIKGRLTSSLDVAQALTI